MQTIFFHFIILCIYVWYSRPTAPIKLVTWKYRRTVVFYVSIIFVYYNLGKFLVLSNFTQLVQMISNFKILCFTEIFYLFLILLRHIAQYQYIPPNQMFSVISWIGRIPNSNSIFMQLLLICTEKGISMWREGFLFASRYIFFFSAFIWPWVWLLKLRTYEMKLSCDSKKVSVF